MTQPVLIDGDWRTSHSDESFQVTDPNTVRKIDRDFPISSWKEIDQCLAAAADAAEQMRRLPRSVVADFLDRYADAMDAAADRLVAAAYEETGLAVSPRLRDVELPRTSGQLRQAAKAARTAIWTQPIIDTAANIRSCLGPIGPVCVFGPNNFPFAFNSAAGGDFAAAMAAGNPVIAKANTSHPYTSQVLGELAQAALKQSDLPSAAVQLLYRTSHADGAVMVADPRVAAIGYTGSRHAGLTLKAAADKAGKPFYAELSSINPVLVLAGAIRERGDAIADDFVTSGLMGGGQFCTNPGLMLLPAGDAARKFIERVVEKYKAAKPSTLLSPSVCKSLESGVKTVKKMGADLLCGGEASDEPRIAFQNTVLRVDAKQFLKTPTEFQTEMFGNAALFVQCDGNDEMLRVIAALEGNLTGCIYTARDGADDEQYGPLAELLATRVGRLLNDKMPTGVAVSPAMNHGGPFPATAHPNFTAVGMPTSIMRFTKLTCYDSVRAERLPDVLRDKNSIEGLWRNIDGRWTTDSI